MIFSRPVILSLGPRLYANFLLFDESTDLAKRKDALKFDKLGFNEKVWCALNIKKIDIKFVHGMTFKDDRGKWNALDILLDIDCFVGGFFFL